MVEFFINWFKNLLHSRVKKFHICVLIGINKNSAPSICLQLPATVKSAFSNIVTLLHQTGFRNKLVPASHDLP